jgi:hypothetical protein
MDGGRKPISELEQEDVTSTAVVPRRRPGRPPVHDEAWTKVTVVLFDRQITFLDQLAGDIRSNTGASMSRAQIIRAFVDSIRDAGVDLTSVTSEADVRSIVTARLRR